MAQRKTGIPPQQTPRPAPGNGPARRRNALNVRAALVLSPDWRDLPPNPPLGYFIEAWCGALGEPALGAATIDGAWLSFDEDRKGSIEPGKLADLAVLDADPLTVEEQGLKTIAAEMSIVGGKGVSERGPGENPAAPLAGL